MKIPRLAFAAALTAALFNVPAVAQQDQSPEITAEQKAEVLKSMGEMIKKQAYVPGVDFSKWDETVEKHRSDLDAAKTQVDFTREVNQALGEYGFSHIVLYSPVMASSRVNQNMVGIGVRIQLEPTGIRVMSVFPKSPAEEVGIQAGDLIVGADGKAVRTPADLAGKEGTRAKVDVVRGSERLLLDVERRKFSTVIPETLQKLDAKTSLLTVPTFDIGYSSKNVNALMEQAMGSDRLIVDLRNNGGGAVRNLLDLCGYFLKPEQALGTFVDKSLVEKYEKATGKVAGKDVRPVAAWAPDKLRAIPQKSRFSGQVVVLVNGATGSASEMFAAAMRDHLGAKVVGSKSAGAVLASYMRPLAQGFVLQYPVTDYVTVKGLRIEGIGIAPDVTTVANRYGEPDFAVVEATKLFEASAGSLINK
ncbi:MAG: PDZ domain-containing protein [Fimbriimonadaceae bacterium]|nr:PDZ domain-containing protein [Fimbriimonadaceae bacterium]QYK55753.1 MAG: PDZ domain-containing protein [Fimbriimonadaceae bacterium]